MRSPTSASTSPSCRPRPIGSCAGSAREAQRGELRLGTNRGARSQRGVSVTAHARARVVATRPSPLGRRYREQGLWQGRLIDRCVVDAAAAEPDRDALIERERRLTFGSFADSVARGAGMLADLGVERGDVVSWQLPNRVEAAIVHHAVARLGAISNPIVPIYRGREVQFILRQAQSRILVVPRTFRRFDYGRMAVDLRRSLPDLEHVL